MTVAPRRLALAHFLALAGVASRRASEDLIRSGAAAVNGQVVRDVATRVSPDTDRVACGGRELSLAPKRYYLLHKPAGYTCSAADRHAARLAIELLALPAGERVFSVGRLDRDSEGLLLFTSDGDLANGLTHPRYGVLKTYCVEVAGRVGPVALKRLEQGVVDEGERLQARQAEVVEQRSDTATLRIVVSEGKKREIRRMCRQLGLRVTRLRRVGFGPLELGEFRPGFSRELTPAELAQLRTAAGLRS